MEPKQWNDAIPQRELELLHPIARESFQILAELLLQAHQKEHTTTLFLPFEGYRSPMRQRFIHAQRPVVTLAKPWESAHNYGLAVDFVARVGNGWSWDQSHDYGFLHDMAAECGLEAPIGWDLCHIQHPAFYAFQSVRVNPRYDVTARKMKEIMQQQGKLL